MPNENKELSIKILNMKINLLNHLISDYEKYFPYAPRETQKRIKIKIKRLKMEKDYLNSKTWSYLDAND